MKSIDFVGLVKKWSKLYEEFKIFETNPDEKKNKFFVTFPYPYLSGDLHLGHAYPLAICDSIARYKRIRGYNVLFPFGFHATGEPIISISKKIKERNEKQINILKMYGVSEEDIKKFEDPYYIVDYFKRRIRETVSLYGCSIDWRRSFTTIDKEYNKFIEWQYLTLREKGYITQGTHPVIFCPKCNSPCGEHDRAEGEEAIIIEYCIIKFKLKKFRKYRDLIVPIATLRPETIFGVTNIWVNPNEEYTIAKVNGLYWIIPRFFAEKLTGQLFNVVLTNEKIKGEELVGLEVENPINGEKIPILPGKFVDIYVGSGIVMSVPAHAPYDYIALRDLVPSYEEYKGVKINRKCLEYNLKGCERDLVLAVFIKDNKVLLGKRSKSKELFPEKWGLIGGRVESGETLIDALIREVKEETNLTLTKIVDIVDAFECEHNGKKYNIYAFLVDGEGEIKINEEFEEYGFFSENEVYGLDLAPFADRIIKNAFYKAKCINLAENCLKSMRSIISVPGFGEFPAKEIVEKMGIKSQDDVKKLENATKIIYKKEFHLGVMKNNCGEFSGMKVKEAKEEISHYLEKKNILFKIFETSEKVVCRCGSICYVKILEDQWFLKYSDENWKKKVINAINSMKFTPKEVMGVFVKVVEWLKDKACARKSGLGTKLPWDKEWIVETLSDSVIYMAFYTIYHKIKENNIPPEKLTKEFFDYIFLGKGNLDELSESLKIEKKLLEDMRREFEYWYGFDLRVSGKDLITNHLTFALFHHVAIWNKEKYWPKWYYTTGMVLVEGEKMSKSKGNFIVLRDLINKHGSDIIRINLLYSAEGGQDPSWTEEGAKAWKNRLTEIYNFLKWVVNLPKKEKEDQTDEYLKNISIKIFKKAFKAIEDGYLRTAIEYGINELFNEIKWYFKRNDCVSNTAMNIIEDFVKFLSIFCPFFAEEIWREVLKKEEFVSLSRISDYDLMEENDKVILKEKIIRDLISDVREILKLIDVSKVKKVLIAIPEGWKYAALIEYYKKDKKVGEVIKKFPELKKYVKEFNKYINQKIESLLDREEERKLLVENLYYISKEIGIKEIEVVDEKEIDESKRKYCWPGKFAIIFKI